ncbi:MAG: anthranilate synthase component I [Dehalococcoidia bacterium]|nr:anthranilate synthase component I [Dehalococcoidia bacterium]
MHQPTLEQVKTLARQGNLVPVYREILADMETPVSAYLKVSRGPYSFLLESVEGGERVARYSFIGTEPYKVVRSGVPVGAPPALGAEDQGALDPLLAIQQELARSHAVHLEGLPRFLGGAVGYLAYETMRYFERLPTPAPDPNALPESVFLFTDTILVFDHLKRKIIVVSHARCDGDIPAAYHAACRRIDAIVGRLAQPMPAPQRAVPRSGPSPAPQSNITQAQHRDMVMQAKEYIVAGDIIQTVISQRLRRATSAHPFDIYRALRMVNPSPYMFYLDMGGFQLVGASPEMLVRVEGDRIATNPIAGTRQRGNTEAEDAALAKELLADEKERAEHVMLVDLGRNDVGRVSVPGTVVVNQLMDIERFSHVMHIVSRVTGTLAPGKTSYDALRACFPAGTVSGAPKIRAMEIIAELEPHQRGPYSGAVGYFDFSGNMDTCIALRTMVAKDGVAYIQAGGGIVYDSQPGFEYQETLHKAAALLRAIDEAEALDLRYGPALQRQEVPAT